MHLQTRGEHQDGLHAFLQPPTEQGERMSEEGDIVFLKGFTMFFCLFVEGSCLFLNCFLVNMDCYGRFTIFNCRVFFLRSGVVNIHA